MIASKDTKRVRSVESSRKDMQASCRTLQRKNEPLRYFKLAAVAVAVNIGSQALIIRIMNSLSAASSLPARSLDLKSPRVLWSAVLTMLRIATGGRRTRSEAPHTGWSGIPPPLCMSGCWDADTSEESFDVSGSTDKLWTGLQHSSKRGRIAFSERRHNRHSGPHEHLCVLACQVL